MIDKIASLIDRDDTERLKSIYEPTVVGVMPEDARRGLCVMPDGEIRRILELQIREIEGRLRQTAPVSLHLTGEAEDYLTRKGYDPKYGARPLRRLLQEELEDPLAEMLLSGRLKNGGTVTVRSDGARLILSEKEAADGET